MKSDIISMTMTELFLMLLFLTIVITQIVPPGNKNSTQLERKLKISSQKLDNLEREKQWLERKLAELKGTKKEKKLKSKQKPSCIEAGLSEGFLASVIIEDKKRYRINQQTYDMAALKHHFSKALKNANTFGCVHSVKVIHQSEINLKDYLSSLKKLERLFYIKRVQ
jgi:hypothetical protein